VSCLIILCLALSNAHSKFKRSPTAALPAEPKSNLSPLASQVLQNVQIDFRFAVTNATRHQLKQESGSLNGVTLVQKFDQTAPSCKPQVTVEIPRPSQDFQREKYAAVLGSPKRRKLGNESRDAEAALRLRTQREQGDAAVLQFQDLLLEIFDFQNRFELDISNGTVPDGLVFFERPDEEEDFKLRLASPTLERLQASLKQLVDLNRLGDILPEHLKRLQQLCEVSIESAQALNLRLSQSPSEDDLATWRVRIRKTESGAASSCVFLYTALGSQNDDCVPAAETLHSIPSLLVNVYETCLIPIIESRQGGQDNELYSIAVSNQGDLRKLLDTCRKLLELLALSCVQVLGAADCVNTTEFLAAKLIFVQNAPTEKASALGSQNYERVRKQAMFSLARLYAAYAEQRSPILDEILSSLDRSPSTSRSARQYKLRDGKSIMLVSALFMQLTQTSALENAHKRIKATRSKHRKTDEDESSAAEDEEMEIDEDDLSRLRDKADELFDPASRSGQEIVLYMVGKASKVSKTGDSPYRNILDLFIEDLVNLLPQPEWPAAELLLRIMAAKMIELANAGKTAGIKNMALESLGTMGSSISESRATARSLAAHLSQDSEVTDDGVSATLARLTDEQFASGLQTVDLFGPTGPFALTAHYYDSKARESLRAKSARSFFLAQYAKLYCIQQLEGETDSQGILDRTAELLEQLSDAALDSSSSTNNGLDDVRQAFLAYLLSILNLGFCRRYELIVRALLSSLSSDQAQVRSRSLKSVVTILERDPSLLDRDPTIADDVFRCASDDSAMVRDAALSVIAKFIVSKPALEEKGIKKLLECAGDNKIGVQKRSIGHLADIYSQEHRPKLKAAISQTFLRRTVDFEESISELAKRTLTDAWISPNLTLVSERADLAKSRIAITNLTSHIVDTLQHDTTDMSKLFTKYLVWLLKNGKDAERLGELLKRFVEVLFQSTIDGSATESSLTMLMAIAEARPQSVAPQQLSHLKRYLTYITCEEDLPMFRSVIGIFRRVLPRLSISHQSLLQDIQGDLMQSIQKLGRRSELDEVMSCLRTIDGVLGNSIRFVKLLGSIVTQIGNPSMNDNGRTRLVRIAGSLGKHIDLDQLPVNGKIPAFRGGSVSGFLTDVIYPYAVKSETETLQLVALESIGAVCQAWPSQFSKVKVRDLFHDALARGDSQQSVIGGNKAQVIALKVFDELYASLAIIKDEPDQEDGKSLEVQDLKKMGGSKKAQDDNSALATMANHVFKLIVNIALSEKGEKALLAVRLLSSVATRGMFHPKDYAHVFLALETSSDPDIREAAENAHRLSHQHHESHWEREYINAVRQAFVYQQQHSEDPSGSWQGRAKLASCFNVVNSSGSKYVKKFISTLISRLGTDFTKLDISKQVPGHVLFVRFVAQNIAFFDYTKQDDLLHTVLQLELLFSKSGGEISQAIETNLPAAIEPIPVVDNVVSSDAPTLIDGELQTVANGHAVQAAQISAPAAEVDPVLLKRLAAASCAVTIISETKAHLKRQYGISRDVRAAMQQNKQAKESTKAPLKVHGITGERFWANTTSLLSSFSSLDEMMSRCRVFLALMTVDDEVRVGEEGDEYRESYSASVDPEALQAPKKGRKRKSEAGSAGGTPKRPRGRAKKITNGTRRSSSTSSREGPDAEYWE
jgi:cohesin loading factor subunit SCC2